MAAGSTFRLHKQPSGQNLSVLNAELLAQVVKRFRLEPVRESPVASTGLLLHRSPSNFPRCFEAAFPEMVLAVRLSTQRRTGRCARYLVNQIYWIVLTVFLAIWPSASAWAQTCGYDFAACSQYESCGGELSTCGVYGGRCTETAEVGVVGEGVCVDLSGLCSEASDCETKSDCPDSHVCAAAASCCSTKKCFPRCIPTCPPTLEPYCFAGQGKLFLKVGDEPQKNKLSWRATPTIEPNPTPFGDPTADDPGMLCVYNNAQLVLGISVLPSSTLWKKLDPADFKYKDGEATTGIARIGEKLIADDMARFTVKGSGASLDLPDPLSADTYFAADGTIEVQWRVYGAECWSTTFAVNSASQNDGKGFRVK